MGDRGQVHFDFGRGIGNGIWLYTHWQATYLPDIVADALAKEYRWNDPEYLARIVFEEMLDYASQPDTGFGIGPSQHGDVYRVVHVDCDEQVVSLEGYDASDSPLVGFQDPGITSIEFEDYIEEYGTEVEA